MSGSSMFIIAPFNNRPLPRRSRFFLAFYLLILLVVAFGARLHPDAYYYWQWSHRLALGYYDGPPMVAYAIKVLTLLFGDQAFSVHLLGIITAWITAWMVFHLGQHLFDIRAGEAALYVWLLTLGVVRFFFLENSYNSLLMIFTVFMLYAFIQLIEKQRCRDYYFCALFAALMLLSKYTAVLWLVSFLLILASRRRYHKLFCSIHFYLALLLIVLLCMPLLWWNFTHHWLSFYYLFAQGFSAHRHYGHTINIVFYLISALLNYHVALLTLLYFLVRDYRALGLNANLQLLFIPMAFIWLFFFVSAWFSLPMMNWSSPCSFPAALLLGYFISRPGVAVWFRRTLLTVMALATLLFTFGCRVPFFYIFPDPAWASSAVMPDLVKRLPIDKYPHEAIMTSVYYMLPSWLAAAFPDRRQQIFSLNRSGNQYYLWWQQAQRQHDYRGQQALYVSQQPLNKLPKPFYPRQLSGCQLIHYEHVRQPLAFYADIPWHLYLYQCRVEG